MYTVPRIHGETIRERRGVARLLRFGDGLLAIVALLAVPAAYVALVAVLAWVSLLIGI